MALSFPEATAFRHQQYKIITYRDKGIETVEFADITTGKLIARKQRERLTSGSDGQWEYTYGSPVDNTSDKDLMSVSSKNPTFLRMDSEDNWEYRVRQIPYPAQTYNVTVDEQRNQIVIRTSNKKYFKRIDAPPGEKFDPSKVDWAWNYGTLVIRHAKPARVKVAEKAEMEWRLKLPCAEDQEPNCPTH